MNEEEYLEERRISLVYVLDSSRSQFLPFHETKGQTFPPQNINCCLAVNGLTLRAPLDLLMKASSMSAMRTLDDGKDEGQSGKT